MDKKGILIAMMLVIAALCTSGSSGKVSFSDKTQLEEDLNGLMGSMDDFEEMSEDLDEFSFSGYDSGGLFG